MLKLTRLNQQTVAINPDHISWVDETPDTTIVLIGGEKMIVRESLDRLVELFVQYRRSVRIAEPLADRLGKDGDLPPVSIMPSRSVRPSVASPPSRRGGY